MTASVLHKRNLGVYCVFVCLAAGVAIAGAVTRPSSRGITAPDRSSFRVSHAPLRGEVKPLRLRRGEFSYRCSECHKTFEASRRYPRLIAEHTDIRLQHGSNDYCLNCHNRDNRDAYVAHDGSEIPADQPALLCAKCHGLPYRDWKNGAHGRRSGALNSGAGEAKQLLCIQCHDPHNPKMPALKPMPGPAVRAGTDCER